MRFSVRWGFPGAASVALSAVVLLPSCADEPERFAPLSSSPPGWRGGSGVDPCATPNAGCSCESEGEVVDCGHVRETHGDYVTCSMGSRVCLDGEWSDCAADRVTLKSIPGPAPQPGLKPAGLGASGECGPDFDVCDPYCNLVSDLPDEELSVPDGFVASDQGLTLTETGSAGDACDSLALIPDVASVTVTDFSPLTVVETSDTAETTNPIGFTLVAEPPGCAPEPFATTWTIDRVDRAAVTGTNNSDGELTLAVPLAGTIHVTAYALGLSTSADVAVKVNVLETASADIAPNSAPSTSHGHHAAFGPWNDPAAGTASSTTYWLYPYEGTYFPLGLPPPVVQFWCGPTSTTKGACRSNAASSTTTRAVKLSLRYPADSSADPGAANYADFNYSLIALETNTVSQNAQEPVDVAASVFDPQIVIPPQAWEYFEQTARGNEADLVLQRRFRTSSTASLEVESRRPIRFVDGQLKGTVYYNSYNSPQGGNTGAVLSIAPGATEPEVAVQPSGRCVVCHTVNLDGTRLIANGSGNAAFNSSRRYDLGDVADYPSPDVLDSYDRSSSSDTENVGGDRFTFGAPFPDGTLYMTHGGTSAGDSNWRAPPDYSKLYDVGDPSSAISVANWPSNISAVTPRFSNNGSKLAFGFWGGSPLPQSSGTLSSHSAGRRLSVVDFSCSSPPCTSSSTGFRVSNARDLTPSVASGLNATAGTLKVGRPTFTPAGGAVIYQRQYRTSRSSSAGGVLSGGWSPSDINTVAGALAELWMSDVPTDGGTVASPTRLLALNGLSASGTPYLPQDNQRAASPLPSSQDYHRNTPSSFPITQADNCGNTGTASGVVDYRLNYLPSIAPIEAGNFVWVIFTSRRMYGNIAYNDPWDAEPCNPNASIPTSCSPNSCYSGTPPTKKLWVAAIDKDWTPGRDPSHPAFYLPGQELEAGNSDGYWVSSPCAGVGERCATSDDCCGGTGASASTECKVVDTSTVPPASECASKSSCSGPGAACSTTDDCCAGLICPDGGGTCLEVASAVYETQVFERVYEADCPQDTLPEWRFFEWQATVPDGASIDFTAQTSATGGVYEPATSAWIGSAEASTTSGTWHRGPEPVQDVLLAQSPLVKSQRFLKVTMTFNPDASGTTAPTLHRWRQIVDCVPAL